MAGYCLGCGVVYDVRAAACPRCRCCPWCGTKQREPAEHCRGCGHPGDEAKLAEMERRLDLATPSNQRTTRGLERGWQNEQTMERLRLGPVVVVMLVALAIVEISVTYLLDLVGLERFWAVATFLGMVLVFWCLRRQACKGRFRWLLREEEKNDAR